MPEKFNAVEGTSNIDAEYGNQVSPCALQIMTLPAYLTRLMQGTDFHLIPREGFGWTNSSYQVGLSFITQAQRRALGALTPPDAFFRAGNVVRD